MNAYQAYFIDGIKRASNTIIVCDHATNTVPPTINNGSLGLSQADMDRHIAYDVGAAGVSGKLGELLDAPVIYSNFSRLVIDPNRGEDDPTLLMRIYDGSIIPANRTLNDQEREHRLNLCYRPYDDALAKLIASRQNPIVIAIHSFTPQLQDQPKRPWEIGVLFAKDQRMSTPLIHSLQKETDLTIGVNQPYKGSLMGDTMDRHAAAAGLLHSLIEIRNDLITSQKDQHRWAERLAPHLEYAIHNHSQDRSISYGL